MPTINEQRNVHGLNLQEAVAEEIEGLIRVYKDGRVERPQLVPFVSPALPSELGVTSWDKPIDELTDVWARFYLPRDHAKLPLLVYFHGGGFCVGSAAWSCYHEFLARLSYTGSCVVMSVNYRLAPENPLPAAYEDGLKALVWLKQEALHRGPKKHRWLKHCDFDKVFLAGDSAGANIAHNVATSLAHGNMSDDMSLKPLAIKGTILIQPFFGGEERTGSEMYMVQPPRSPLSMAVSDAYWRLALPQGANRDHIWCNPLASESIELEGPELWPTLVCVSEMDVLRDRNLEFCSALAKAGQSVEYVVLEGVGHAFQVLSKSSLSQARTQEMMAHINAFISRP